MINKEQDKFATIFFYKDKIQSYYGDSEPFKINNILIVVDAQIPFDLKSAIANANDEFEILLEQSPKITNQVKRLFIEISFQDSILKEKVESFIELIKNEFPKTELFQSFEVFPPIEIQDTVMPRLLSFDVEIVFDEPLTDEKLIERMRKFIPQIKKTIYGFGFLSGYEDIQDFPVHLHLYARQF